MNSNEKEYNGMNVDETLIVKQDESFRVEAIVFVVLIIGLVLWLVLVS